MIIHPSTRDVVKRYDVEAIKGAVKNILYTSKGEKLFNPNFGADLYKYLFEPLSHVKKALMKRQIREELSIWEPRINVSNIDISEVSQAGMIKIDVEIILKDNPTIVEHVNINLERAR
jgi:phage baseplate assembly protein W